MKDHYQVIENSLIICIKFLACHLLNTMVDVWKQSSLRVVTEHTILALGRKDKMTSSRGRFFYIILSILC